jgi:hypothetical protein
MMSCWEWHGDGTVGEDDRGSGLMATLPARVSEGFLPRPGVVLPAEEGRLRRPSAGPAMTALPRARVASAKRRRARDGVPLDA